MTTETDELGKRILELGLAKENTEGVPIDGFADPTGEFPKREYFFGSSLNKAARGEVVNNLYNGGGDIGVPLLVPDQKPSIFPFNQVQESLSGHVIEVDDTPGGERVLIKHNTGSGVECKADGSVVISSRNHKVEICGGDNTVIVEGRANLVYHGNLNLTVSGDYNVTVGGNYNVDVAGNKTEKIQDSHRKTVGRNESKTIKGSRDQKILGENTDIILRGNNLMVKGLQRNYVQGGIETTSDVGIFISGREEVSVSSKLINIAGATANFFGNDGLIGGELMEHFGVLYSGPSGDGSEGDTGTTFRGDLQGRAAEATIAVTAKEAFKANTAVSVESVTPPIENPTFVYSENDIDPTKTMPNVEIMTAYLASSAYAIRNVKVDPNNELFNKIVKTDDYDNILDHEPTVAEVRSKLRDEANRENSTFTGSLVSEGRLNSNFRDPAPGEIGRIVSAEPSARFGETLIGNNPVENRSKRFTPARVKRPITIIPDALYNPEHKKNITSDTRLGPGITMARFLGAPGNRTSFNFITTNEERKKIARQLYLHAEIMRMVRENTKQFVDYRLVVTEGIYKPYRSSYTLDIANAPGETITADSINDLKNKGRAVVYQMVGKNGRPDANKTFQLAEYWKDYCLYEKLILDYDKYSPDGSLSCQVIVVMPDITSSYNTSFSFEVFTQFNSKRQDDGLVEILN